MSFYFSRGVNVTKNQKSSLSSLTFFNLKPSKTHTEDDVQPLESQRHRLLICQSQVISIVGGITFTIQHYVLATQSKPLQFHCISGCVGDNCHPITNPLATLVSRVLPNASAKMPENIGLVDVGTCSDWERYN
jgi:hypothetical protein